LLQHSFDYLSPLGRTRESIFEEQPLHLLPNFIGLLRLEPVDAIHLLLHMMHHGCPSSCHLRCDLIPSVNNEFGRLNVPYDQLTPVVKLFGTSVFCNSGCSLATCCCHQRTIWVAFTSGEGNGVSNRAYRVASGLVASTAIDSIPSGVGCIRSSTFLGVEVTSGAFVLKTWSFRESNSSTTGGFEVLGTLVCDRLFALWLPICSSSSSDVELSSSSSSLGGAENSSSLSLSLGSCSSTPDDVFRP
jgi:hypothetical protein